MSRETVILILLLIVALIHVATMVLAPQYIKDTLEILKYVVIAIVAYYLGYSQRELKHVKANPDIFKEKKVEIRRLGYIFVGFGIGLIIEHVVCHGVDLTLISHEWVGLFVLIAGLLMIGYTQEPKSIAVKGIANPTKIILLIIVALLLGLALATVVVFANVDPDRLVILQKILEYGLKGLKEYFNFLLQLFEKAVKLL